MKILNYIVLSLLVVSAWVGCSKDESIGFDIDNNSIEIDAAGGTRSFKVSSDDNWVTSASVPWVTVTPANGFGCRECRILIDSALTAEGLPYEVQYLTGAEELEFYSNVNTFQLSLSTGEYICKLEHLKRLTIGAYGLTELHEDFKNLRELEYLDLGSNNFQRVPDVINPQNFPKLHVLRLANNQRRLIYDLSNNISTDFGGFYDETAHNGEQFGPFPSRLLKWTADEANGVTGLDTLVLSVNYLQGSIPSFEDDNTVGYYTEQDIVNSADTLPRKMLTVKKVMPQLKMFTINLNRLTGPLPEWLLYHPSLDWWDPGTLIFTQEGKDELGNLAGFSNQPANMNYYYEVYTKKKQASVVGDDGTASSGK